MPTAPCGCPGTVIIGTFVKCNNNCKKWQDANAVPTAVNRKNERTEPMCRHCGSIDLKKDGYHPMTGSELLWCKRCKTYV